MTTRAKWLTGGMVAVAVALAGVPIAWVTASNAARADVVVLTDARAFECVDTDDATSYAVSLDALDAVDALDALDEITIEIPAVRLSDGLDCTYSFTLHNTGPTDVEISSIRLPFMGAQSGAGLRATMLDYQGLSPKHTGSVDAVFDLTTPTELNSGPAALAAGEAHKFTVHLAFADGCVSDGGAVIVDEAPIAGITARGLGGTIVRPGPAYALVGTAESGC